jgi:hypothetical protein
MDQNSVLLRMVPRKPYGGGSRIGHRSITLGHDPDTAIVFGKKRDPEFSRQGHLVLGHSRTNKLRRYRHLHGKYGPTDRFVRSEWDIEPRIRGGCQQSQAEMVKFRSPFKPPMSWSEACAEITDDLGRLISQAQSVIEIGPHPQDATFIRVL